MESNTDNNADNSDVVTMLDVLNEEKGKITNTFLKLVFSTFFTSQICFIRIL